MLFGPKIGLMAITSRVDSGSGVFDPTADVFLAQSERPPGLHAVDFASLSAYQRSLLVIDGTVTRFIEAWWLETVRIRRITQESVRLSAAEHWLGLAAGATAIRREVLLLGARSGRLFAWAETLLADARLPAGVQDQLGQEDGGLGRILINTASETRREGLWCGVEERAAPAAWSAGSPPLRWLTRSYRVIAAGQPLMWITERFPLESP